MATQGDISQAAETVVDSEALVNMDERMATILHLQQVQQKQEVTQLMESHPVTNADAEFRRGLEELVRDHFNTCMAIASCSSGHDAGGSDSLSHTQSFSSVHEESGSSHSHRQQVSLTEAGDSNPADSTQSVTSNDPHHHNQFALSVHVDGQHIVDEENEAQRLGRHPQSRESSTSEHSPSRLQSRIMNRWDDRQTRDMITTMERQARESELLALASLHTVTMLDASFLQESSSPRSDVNAFERPQRRESSLFQMWRELEGDDQDSDRPHTYETVNNGSPPELPGLVEPEQDRQTQELLEEGTSQLDIVAAGAPEVPDQRTEPDEHGRQWGPEDPESVSREENHRDEGLAPIGNAERDRVRQVMQRWMMQARVAEISTSPSSSPNHADDLIGQGERERIRQLAREWVRAGSQHSAVTSQQGRANSSQSQTNSSQPQGPIGGFVGLDQESMNSGSQSQRDIQMSLDLLMRSDMERQSELQGLLQHRAVSAFAHRSRLQSFLRGRFLRNGANIEGERPPSLAAGEIGQLRQRRAVSGMREGFRFRLENILADQVNQVSGEVEGNIRGGTRRRNRMQQAGELAPRGIERESDSSGVSRDWHGLAASRRISELQDATAYNMELRELLSRRSVTTILASEFRDRLDLLIESFIERSGRSARPWNFARSSQSAPSQQQQVQQQQRRQAQVQNAEGDMVLDAVPSPPPPPPPGPLQWAHGPQWTPRPQHHPAEMVQESQSTNDLRAEIANLQRSLADLQRMVETSMEMQLELQRSVRQEVAGALHRAHGKNGVPGDEIDGSKWLTVKKGTCCICCDKQIDSLLYRCGHMCTCLKCASELIGNSGKCPMCRAPIVEVVRAFTVA